MADHTEEDVGGVPEWIVTFGDMMSLLLTFFIMLTSLSEIKQEKQYQALVDSIRRKFGHDTSMASLAPGNTKPQNSKIANLATTGRSKRLDKLNGGQKIKAPRGDEYLVRIVRPGTRTAVGTVITFSEGSAELTDKHEQDLRLQAGEIGGKPQKIEIRGHTSRRPVAQDSAYRDNWELAYRRSRNTMDYLISLGIDPRRIRVSVAGPSEPLHTGTDPIKLKTNARVEVYLLDEMVEDHPAAGVVIEN